MGLSGDEIAVIVIGFIVGLAGSIFTYRVTPNMKPRNRVLVTMAVFLVVVGVFSVFLFKKRKDKEKFEQSSDGCVQQITINQNCSGKNGGGSHPILPINNILSQKQIQDWIKSVNPDLTKECQSCVMNSVVNLWNQDTLNKVKSKSLNEQKLILSALLAVDCTKQCVIPAPVESLTKDVIEKWLMTILHKPINKNCISCLVNAVLKLWNVEKLQMAQSKSPDEQRQIVNAMWLMHCLNCDENSLNPNDVKKWLNGVLSGARSDCYECLVNSIVRLWSVKDFEEVQKMSNKSQTQVVQAMIAVQCDNPCTSVPTGLDGKAVQNWLNTVLTTDKPVCGSCVFNNIMKLWTPTQFANVQKMPLDNQKSVVQGLIVSNCMKVCGHNYIPISPSSSYNLNRVLMWVKSVLKDCNDVCQSCIASNAFKLWKFEDFMKAQGLNDGEKVKMLKALSDFYCGDECGNRGKSCVPGRVE